jgi:hypothetical protein
MGAFLEPEIVVRTLIFFSASLVAWLVLINRPQHFGWLILFLFLPNVIKNHLVHLRQGLAIAIFLWGWFTDRRFLCLLLIGLSPLIHSSFFIVLTVLCLAKSLKYFRLNINIRIVAFIGLGVGVSLLLNVIASLLDARQAEQYKFTATEVSGLGFLVWIFILATWLSAGRQFNYTHVFETGLIIFYLSSYWLVEVTARIFESGLMLVLLGGLSLPLRQRNIFLFTIATLGVVLWLIRVGSPTLGFS